MEKKLIAESIHCNILNKYRDGKYGTENDLYNDEFVNDVRKFITYRTGLAPARANVILIKTFRECVGQSHMDALAHVKNVAEMFAEVTLEPEVERKMEVSAIEEKDAHTCNACNAKNYVSKHDGSHTRYSSRLYSVLIGNMRTCLCADCLNVLAEKANEVIKEEK